MRKIRVICSDPYATDCSSDDEDSIEKQRPTNGKLFVQEISVSMPTIHQDSVAELRSDATDSSSREDGSAKDGPICINQEIDSTVSESHRSMGRAKHPGIKMTASGKWGVRIHHPIQGTTIWLGSYNTIEEATNVYEKEKLEFALLSELFKQKNPDVQRAKHRRQRYVVDGMTIFETVSDKWAAWTRDPVSNVNIWLGLYTTPEEAVKSYCRKKLDFDSNCNPEGLGKGSPSVQGNPHDATSPIDTDVASFRCPGIKLTTTGRWGVTIYHPSLKCRYWLGSYDTPEEAAQVYDKKKNELDAGSGSHGDKNIASTYVINSQGLPVTYKGIRLRQSGRWSAEIKDPFKRKNTHIGTYDTPEEAADAYNKRKRKIADALISRGKKQKCIGDAENSMIKTEPNNASLSFTLDAENSTVTAVSSQDSEGSNTNNNDKQIPCSSLAAEDEFGFGVINSYGQLIGEYSSLDDELWLTGPGDYDECDVNGPIGSIEDLALDHKPSSYLPN